LQNTEQAIFLPKELYRDNLKNREWGKEAAQIFASGASDPCLWQGASEGQKDAAKPTTPKIDCSGCFGITRKTN
jgi:hypothetical protein